MFGSHCRLTYCSKLNIEMTILFICVCISCFFPSPLQEYTHVDVSIYSAVEYLDSDTVFTVLALHWHVGFEMHR